MRSNALHRAMVAHIRVGILCRAPRLCVAMNDSSRDFCDLIQLVDLDRLTHIVTTVDQLHDSHARSIAVMLLELRDEGDEQDRALAANSIYDYVRAWLQHKPIEQMRGPVDHEEEYVTRWMTRN